MKTYLFWLRSNRGTNEKAVFSFPEGTKAVDIQFALKDWCSRFGAWTHGDNYLTYGYKPVKVPPKAELMKKWKKVCDSYTRAKEAREIVRELLNVQKGRV